MDWLEQLALAVTPDRKEAGYLVYNLHVIIVGLLPLLFLFVQSLRSIILVIWFPFFLYHILYRKCPLTRIERRLHGEDRTVLDPLITFLGLRVNKTSRDLVHVVLSSIFMVGMLSIFMTSR